MTLNSLQNTSVQMTKQKFTAGQTTADCQLKMIPAVILHPSLGAPLVVEAGKPVSLFIVADKTFMDEFLESNGKNNDRFAKGGTRLADLILQHLKVLEWDKATLLKKDLSTADEVSLNTIVSKNNILTTYLGDLEDSVVNAQGHHFGNVRPSFKEALVGFREDGKKVGRIEKFFSNDGVRHLFQIDLIDANISAGTMYDCFWLLSNLDPQKVDVQDKYLDIQDRIAREYLQGKYYQYSGEDGPGYAFKANGDGVDFSQFDMATPIQTRHPIYVTDNRKKMNFGHLSDIHVSSKQHTYKGRKATVIPGVDTSTSPYIGDMANNNADNLFDLLEQFGADDKVDAVIITGDLYDHMHNYDPAKLAASTTGKLWEAMYVDSVDAVQKRNDDFPCGIDGLAVYSLLCFFYRQYGKPVFIICGNHEAYEYPYGISPRIGSTRANEGIPLDHNLTIYEAILLYGPGYSKVIPGVVPSSFSAISKARVGQANFQARNFDWFYRIFTPLTDYWQQCGQQLLICVGWGDGEDFFWNPTPVAGFNAGGTLPRATESIGTDQRSLVDTALSLFGRECIFCSHFTLINYSLDAPLSETGKVGVTDTSYSPYEHGTTKSGRKYLHDDWLANNKFKIALSGHSHRVGLYHCSYVSAYEPFATQAGTNAYLQMGSRMSTANQPAYFKTIGYHPDAENTKHLDWKNTTQVLVSASAGPIPKQNLAGEMSGQGMEKPSGSFVDSEGNISLVKVNEEKRKSAKPRFCVACDYIDIIKDGFWEYFKAVGEDGVYEMKPHWGKINPKWQQKGAEKPKIFDSIVLWIIESGRSKKYECAATVTGDSIQFQLPDTLPDLLKSRRKYIDALFISMIFEEAILSAAKLGDYDYSSAWNIQIGFYGDNGGAVGALPSVESQPRRRMNENMKNKKADENPAGWHIMRHKKFGEEPDLKERAKIYPQEYSYNLNQSR